MFVITGATGNTGSVVARKLLDAGKPVRLLVRDPVKARALVERGAEVVEGDIRDAAAVARAFSGAEGIYLLSPPDLAATDFVAERRPLMQALAQAAHKARAGHVVLLSSVGAHQVKGTGPIVTLHDAEQALRATGLPVTFVRASYFMENWAPVLPVAQKDGVLPSFLPASVSFPSVSVRDIGPAAAQALLAGPRGTRIIELAGPRSYVPGDVSAAAARVLGRPVSLAESPLDAVVPTFTSFGLSENIATLYRELYAGLISGLVAPEPSQELQRGPTDIDAALAALLPRRP
jgi:uncharacterized protein YbjT (DUF2867 family)